MRKIKIRRKKIRIGLRFYLKFTFFHKQEKIENKTSEIICKIVKFCIFTHIINIKKIYIWNPFHPLNPKAETGGRFQQLKGRSEWTPPEEK